MRQVMIGLLLGIFISTAAMPAQAAIRQQAPGADLLPSAWLRVGHKTIQGSLGSYCWHGSCADMASDEALPHLATAVVGARSRVTIIVSSRRIRSMQARIHPLTQRAGAPPHSILWLTLHPARAGNRTAAILRLGAGQSNEMLDVFVSFAPTSPQGDRHIEAGDATYVWRLLSG